MAAISLGASAPHWAVAPSGARLALAIVGMLGAAVSPAFGVAAQAASSEGSASASLGVARPPASRSARLALRGGATDPAPAEAGTTAAPDGAGAAAGARTNRVAPQANDTIPEEYWIKVNRMIAEAALVTPRPPSRNDPAPPPTQLPWQQVYAASSDVTVLDTPQDQAVLNNWELATPMPVGADAPLETPQVVRSMGVVPYDMQIGARIMDGLSEHAPPTPPPSQTLVNEAFVAQCPMVIFANQLSVRAPRCGADAGEWADPDTDRVILRWKDDGKGGLNFGVDSVVTGDGSVNFASFTESFSIDKYIFHLYNCLGVKRYTVEEQVVRVDHMAAKAHSTMYDHDVANSREAIFYRYMIKNPNGTAVATTQLFRMGQDMLNISTYSEEQVGEKLIAIAQRSGHWKREQWRQCTGNPRGWDLTFPDEARTDTVATVQDLHVAAAAVITMMAFRDEAVGEDGFQHVGQAQLYWSLISSALLIIFAVAAFCVMLVLCRSYGYEKKCRRLCFRLEQVLMPRRPAKVRQPVLHPSY